MAKLIAESSRKLMDATGKSATPRLDSIIKSMKAAFRKSAGVEDSYEDHMAKVRPVVIAGSGCSNPPPEDTGYPVPSEADHWCDVVATFPDYAIVTCNTEDKAWKVPYEMDGDNPEAGEPEEITQTWVPVETDEAGTEAE